MSKNIPPPEYFMRGKPDPPYKRVCKAPKVYIYVFAFLLCSSVLATLMVPDTAQAGKRPFKGLKIIEKENDSDFASFSFQRDEATGYHILTAWYSDQIHVVITGILDEKELKVIFENLN